MLDDKDRIFRNLYGQGDWGLEGARRRGAWDGTKAIINQPESVAALEYLYKLNAFAPPGTGSRSATCRPPSVPMSEPNRVTAPSTPASAQEGTDPAGGGAGCRHR